MTPTNDINSQIDNHERWLKTTRKGTPPDLADQDLTQDTSINFSNRKLSEALLQRTKMSRLNLSATDLVNSRLEGADLSYSQFQNANLKGANLTGSNLTGANLTGANLTGANLTGANLTGANLTRTQLHHSNMQNADLTGITNLTTQQVGGANLQGIKNKDAVAIDTTSQLDEALKNAGKLYQTLITLCAFCLLVIFSTSDLDILTHSGTAKLPIIDFQISKDAIFLVTPFLVMIVFVSFHLHLLRAWEMMLEFPAIFPDGKTIIQKSYPLHLNSIILTKWEQLKNNLPKLTPVRHWFSVVVAYWVAPFTLFAFYYRYRPGQFQTTLNAQIVLELLAIIFARYVWLAALQSITGSDSIIQVSTKNKTSLIIILLYVIYSLTNHCLLFMTDPTFLLNDNFGYAYTQHLRQSLSAQLNRAEIVPKPPNFRQWIDRPEVRPDDPNNDPKIKEKLNLYLAQYNQITNAPDLNTANLRFAKGVYAFLPKVNLSQAEMAGADFTRANMSLADLFLADLRGSTLSEAILLKADLTQADCRRAKMVGVDLRGAKLNSADLRNANLTGALLQGATYIPSGEYATKWPDEITAEYLRKVGAVAVDKKGKVLEASQSAPTKP